MVSAVTDPSAPITRLLYRVWRPVGDLPRGDAVLQLKGTVMMANYHFRRNVERIGIDLTSVTTRVHWDRGAEGECRLEIEAPASEETLSMALGDAVQLVGLRAERF
jgi:hypothetical protein